MPASRKLLAALLVAAAAAGQQTASVTGTVTNSINGAPILHAHIMLRNGPQVYGALTNGDGKFSISGMPPGTYFPMATRVGYASPELAFPPHGLELRAGDNKDAVDLKLTPLGAITGRVLDADGEPIQMASVMVQIAGNEQATTTDNKGQYRIGGLSPGKYRVRAWPESRNLPPEIRTDGSKQLHYAPTYYPGVQSMKEAAAVPVQPGSEISGIDIRLVSTPLVKVSGKILDIPAGKHDVFINVMHQNGMENSEGFYARPAKADGSFVVWGVNPGKYMLQAQSGDGRNLQSAPVDLDVGASDIEHIELRMMAPFDISGQLRFEDERAKQAPKTLDEGPRAGMPPQLALQPLHEGNTVEAEIKPDDSFRFEKVPPGRYRVELTPGGAFVRSLRLGSAEVEGDILDVRNGAGGGLLTLTISVNTGEISGTVSDSKGPVAGAAVQLMGEGNDVSWGEESDGAGHYSFRNVRPGKYILLASDGKTDAMMFGRGALADFEDFLGTVEVHAGDKATKDLKMFAQK